MKFVFRYIFPFLLIAGMFAGCNDDPEGIYGTVAPVQLSSIPGTGRASAVAFAINGKGYILTGKNNNSKDSLKQVWEYNP